MERSFPINRWIVAGVFLLVLALVGISLFVIEIGKLPELRVESMKKVGPGVYHLSYQVYTGPGWGRFRGQFVDADEEGPFQTGGADWQVPFIEWVLRPSQRYVDVTRALLLEEGESLSTHVKPGQVIQLESGQPRQLVATEGSRERRYEVVFYEK